MDRKGPKDWPRSRSTGDGVSVMKRLKGGEHRTFVLVANVLPVESNSDAVSGRAAPVAIEEGLQRAGSRRLLDLNR